MGAYNIVLSHGPVTETKYLGDNTVSYILEDGSTFDIQFYLVTIDGKKMHKRIITTDGCKYFDTVEFDIFEEGLTCEDFARWTADNFSEEILECIDVFPVIED